jgi:hypothetical protein
LVIVEHTQLASISGQVDSDPCVCDSRTRGFCTATLPPGIFRDITPGRLTGIIDCGDREAGDLDRDLANIALWRPSSTQVSADNSGRVVSVLARERDVSSKSAGRVRSPGLLALGPDVDPAIGGELVDPGKLVGGKRRLL